MSYNIQEEMAYAAENYLEMGKTTKPASEPQEHIIRIKYDPVFDHYMIDGQYTFTRPVMVIDGFEANRILEMYLSAFFHEVNAIRKQAREVPDATKISD